jgi:hypothetical protein
MTLLQRSLPSSSTNKRKRQDAFIEASPFDISTPRRVPTNLAVSNDSTALGLDPQRHDATPSSFVTAGSRSKNQGSKPKGIMAFSPTTRGIAGIGKGVPETPSKAARIPSPGFTIPTGFTLLRPPGLPSPTDTGSSVGTRGGLEKAAGGLAKGMPRARYAMTPLSSLTAQTRTTGSPSPVAGHSKTRNLHPLAQPGLFASRQPTGHDDVRSESSDRGLRTLPHSAVLSIAQAHRARSTSIEPEHVISMTTSLGHEMTRGKGKAAE